MVSVVRTRAPSHVADQVSLGSKRNSPLWQPSPGTKIPSLTWHMAAANAARRLMARSPVTGVMGP
jgi:hypothetical protein